jgi:hypothetical protein
MKDLVIFLSLSRKMQGEFISYAMTTAFQCYMMLYSLNIERASSNESWKGKTAYNLISHIATFRGVQLNY